MSVKDKEYIDNNGNIEEPEEIESTTFEYFNSQMLSDIKEGNTTVIPEGMDIHRFISQLQHRNNQKLN